MSDAHEFRHTDDSVEHFTPAEVAEAEHDVLGYIDLDPASCPKANQIIGAKRIFTKDDNGFAREWRADTMHLNPPGGKCDETGRPVIAATKKRKGCLETGACGLAPGSRDAAGKVIPGHSHKGVTSSAKAWWFRYAAAYHFGLFNAGIFIAFNLDIFQTTQIDTPVLEGEGSCMPLRARVPLDFDFCIPRVRLEYLSEGEDGEIVPGESPTHASAIILLASDTAIRDAFEDRLREFGKVVRR